MSNYTYKYKVGDRVNNLNFKSGVVFDGFIKSLSTGEEVAKFQPSKPGPYYYVEDIKTGWLIGCPEDRLEASETNNDNN